MVGWTVLPTGPLRGCGGKFPTSKGEQVSGHEFPVSRSQRIAARLDPVPETRPEEPEEKSRVPPAMTFSRVPKENQLNLRVPQQWIYRNQVRPLTLF